MNITACPTNAELTGFVEGQLEECRIDEIAAHLDGCHLCMAVLNSVETDANSLEILIRKSNNDPADVKHDTFSAHNQNTVKIDSTDGSSKEPGLAENGVSDRYQILDEVGRGGIGNISRALDSKIGRELAIKVLQAQHSDRQEVVQRFVEEAQIAGQLEHPGIVPVYEMGKCTDNRPFFTMKLINGQTLDQILADSKPDNANRQHLLNIFLQICHAVAYAHSKGVVHRDLKPVNVMIGEFGEVQVMDWGLAKLVRNHVANGALEKRELSDRSSQTSSGGDRVLTLRDDPHALVSIDGTVLGTPSYMPPEQAQGNIQLVGKSSDVFSLGAILLEILTGVPPYTEATVKQLLARASSGDLQDAMRRLEEANVDPELEQLIRHCLETEPFNRPPNARHVAQRIEAYLRSIEDRIEQAKIAQAKAATSALNERRIRQMTLTLVTSIAAALLFAGFFWFNWQSEKRQKEMEAINQLKQSVARAKRFLDESDPTNTDDRSKGLAALEIAEDLASAPYISTALKENTRDLSRAYRTLESDRSCFLALEKLRQGPSTFDFEEQRFDRSEILSGYEQIFQGLGITPEAADVEQATEKLRSKPDYLLDALITGIDLWTLRIEDRKTRQFWFKTAHQLDGQKARRKVRMVVHDSQGYSNREPILRNFEPSEHSPDSIYVLAAHLDVAQQTDQAIAILRESIPYFPGEYWLHKLLAQTLFNHRPDREDEIFRLYSIAAAIRPNNEAAQVDLLQGCIHARRFDEAIVVGERIIQKNPRLVSVHVALAEVYHHLKRFEQAEVFILDALELAPERASALSCYGNVLAGLNRFPESIEQHTKVIEFEPSSFRGHCNLAMAYQAYGEFEQSLEKLQKAESQILKAIELKPDWAHGYFSYGIVLYSMARIAGEDAENKLLINAVGQFQRALTIRNQWLRAELHLLLPLARLERRAEAEPLARRLAQDSRLTSDELQLLALYYRSLDDFDAARGLLDRAVDAPGNTIQQRYGIAQLYHSIRAFDQCGSLLQSLLAARPNDFQFLDLLATNEYASGNLEMARSTWESVVRHQENRIDIWKRLAGVYSKLHLHREMELACRKISKSEPSEARWLYDQANALQRQRKFGQAIAVYERCLKLNPLHCMAAINHAQALTEAGRFDDSRRQYKYAMNLDSEKRRWTSTIRQGLNRLDRVEQVAAQISAVPDGEFQAEIKSERLEFALVSQLIGRHRTALKLFRELIAEADSEALVRNNSLYYQSARSAAAICQQLLASSAPQDLNSAAEFDQLAFDMIQTEFAERESMIERPELNDFRRKYALMLRQWQTDPLLRHVREENLVTPDDSASSKRWRTLWDEIEESFRRNW